MILTKLLSIQKVETAKYAVCLVKASHKNVMAINNNKKKFINNVGVYIM